MSNGCAVNGFGSSAARAPAAGVAAFEAVFGFSEGLRASGFVAGSVPSAVSLFPGPLPLCAAGGGGGVAVDFAASVWDVADDAGTAAE